MDRTTATAGNKNPRQPGRVDALCHGLAIAAAAVVVALTGGLDHWSLIPLLLLGAFMVVSALTDVAAGGNRLRIAGVLIGMLQAVVLLGPGPAAALGAVTTTIVWIRTRSRPPIVLGNVATYAWCGLLAGLQFQAAVRLLHLAPST